MGNRFTKRIKFSSNNNNNRFKLQKSVKKRKNNKSSSNSSSSTNEEIEFKFIINDVLNNNSNALEIDDNRLAQEFSNFINSKKTNSLQHAEQLDDYYTQLDCLATNYAISLKPNKTLVKFVRATCFTRDQEADCTKLYLNFGYMHK